MATIEMVDYEKCVSIFANSSTGAHYDKFIFDGVKVVANVKLM